jgi:hypothetical protein
VDQDVAANFLGGRDRPGSVGWHRAEGRMMEMLVQNQQLTVGHQLVARNVNLILQGDGNLVLYRTMFGLPLFASGTDGRPVNRAVMQADGNFVLYAADGTAYWDTGTWAHPGSRIVLQDDGNLVVYSPGDEPLWTSNTVQNWNSPTVRYSDAHGYSFDETSESWKDFCLGLPCFMALQWPDYATAKFEVTLKGQAAVIQVWKGWCQKFLGLQDFPGGVGGEVGVYRRVSGRARPTSLPGIPQPFADLVLGLLANLPDTAIWWPAPELADSVSFSLTNTVNNTTFFSSVGERTYWNCKWMEDGSYSTYQRDQGKRWGWLPSWWPGNSLTPPLAVGYTMNLTVNGQNFSW